MAIYLANDKYRTTLRSTWVSDPAATTLQVKAIPDNLPTIVVVGWETELETVFYVTSASGDSSANYALTGVTRLKGANTDLPADTAINCLNNEEFFNQYSSIVNEDYLKLDDQAEDPATPAAGKTLFYLKSGKAYTKDDAGTVTQITSTTIDDDTMATASDDSLATSESIVSYVGNQVSTASSATPTPTGDRKTNELYVTALAAAAEFAAPSGTPVNGHKLLIRVKDNGTARALTWNAIYDGFYDDLPSTTTISKTLYLGFIYDSAATKWNMVAKTEEG